MFSAWHAHELSSSALPGSHSGEGEVPGSHLGEGEVVATPPWTQDELDMELSTVVYDPKPNEYYMMGFMSRAWKTTRRLSGSNTEPSDNESAEQDSRKKKVQSPRLKFYVAKPSFDEFEGEPFQGIGRLQKAMELKKQAC